MSYPETSVWDKALELAAGITNPTAAAVFTVVIVAFLVSILIAKKSLHHTTQVVLIIAMIALALLGLVPSILSHRDRSHHVHILVMRPDGSPAAEAKVTSAYGEAPLEGAGRWEATIADQLRPADGKVRFFAQVPNEYLAGDSTATLGTDLSPQITIQLRPLPSTIMRGVVKSGNGKSVEGASVSVTGYPEKAVTDSMGNFSLPAHAADGQMVQVRAEKGMQKAESTTPAGSTVELVLR